MRLFPGLALVAVLLATIPLASAHGKLDSSATECVVCEGLVYTVDTLLMTNASLSAIIKGVTSFCTLSGIEDAEVCGGLSAAYTPVVVDVFEQVVLSPQQVCQELGFCSASSSLRKTAIGHAKRILDRQAVRLGIAGPDAARQGVYAPPDDFQPHMRPVFDAANTKPKRPFPSVPSGTFVHLTDLHFDPEYAAGSPVKCGQPVCCRADSPNITGAGQAGICGEYACDLTTLVLDGLVAELKALDPTPDFVLWTGDNPPHDVWRESAANKKSIDEALIAALNEAFPEVPIYPALGNHEAWPCDEYDWKNQAWFNDQFASLWAPWLPESALATIQQGIYYSVEITDGLRLIVLNTQLWDLLNFYNLLDYNQPGQDPAGMMTWLEGELAAAADAGDLVYLMGHIPMGTGGVTQMSHLFIPLLQRYNATIAGQFFGHTHQDSFEIVYGDYSGGKRTDPIGVSFIAPAVTSFTDIRSSYRVYKQDGGVLQDYDQYRLDLDACNANGGHPKWDLAYSARDAYGLADLSAASFDGLVARMRTNDTLFQTYYQNYITGFNASATCTGVCAGTHFCMMTSASGKLFGECNL